MAKKQTVDHATDASPKTAAHRKGRQASQKTSEARSAAPIVAAKLGDRAKDNASAPAALLVAVTPALENCGQAQKPDDPGGVSEKNSESYQWHSCHAETVSGDQGERRVSEYEGGAADRLARTAERRIGPATLENGSAGCRTRCGRPLTGLRHAGREVSRDKNAEGGSIRSPC
jgi:hypothetical protein